MTVLEKARAALIAGGYVPNDLDPYRFAKGDDAVEVDILIGRDKAALFLPAEKLARFALAELAFKTLEAQEAYEQHFVECETCQDLSVCSEGADLWLRAQELRKDLFGTGHS